MGWICNIANIPCQAFLPQSHTKGFAKIPFPSFLPAISVPVGKTMMFHKKKYIGNIM